MIKQAMAVLILAGLLLGGVATGPALAADRGSPVDDLLIYEVSCTPDGAFSAHGFARRVSNSTGSVTVTIDLIGTDSNGLVLSLTYTGLAHLTPLPNPNGKPNGNANGHIWSVNDRIATIPELGEVTWSATYVKVTLTNRWGSTVKETDLPLPRSPF